jgi:hypothetical protein
MLCLKSQKSLVLIFVYYQLLRDGATFNPVKVDNKQILTPNSFNSLDISMLKNIYC